MNQKHFTLTIAILMTSIMASAQTDTMQKTFEGYYQVRWESSAFFEQKEDKIHEPVWLEFNGSFQRTDSLANLLTGTILRKGVFIRFEGKKTTGGNFGHLGASEDLVTVSRILFIDTTKTFDTSLFRRNDGNN